MCTGGRGRTGQPSGKGNTSKPSVWETFLNKKKIHENFNSDIVDCPSRKHSPRILTSNS